MLLHDARDQDPAVVQELLGELRASNPVSHGLLLPDGEATALDGVRASIGFAPSWLEASATTAYKLTRLFSAEFAAAVAGRDASRELVEALDRPGQLDGRAPLNQSLYLWSKVVLPNYVLTFLGDRMEMAHSVEGRLPFLDHHIVELCRDLPVPQKIRGMTEKYVLREAARPVLTATVYGRHKHPFMTPPAALAREGRLFELTQDTLRGATMAALPFFDRAKVVALLDDLHALDEASRTAYDPALMILLSACALHAGYGLSGDGRE
jgi:asparagine synthase (glutamine-hydrolysing)